MKSRRKTLMKILENTERGGLKFTITLHLLVVHWNPSSLSPFALIKCHLLAFMFDFLLCFKPWSGGVTPSFLHSSISSISLVPLFNSFLSCPLAFISIFVFLLSLYPAIVLMITKNYSIFSFLCLFHFEVKIMQITALFLKYSVKIWKKIWKYGHHKKSIEIMQWNLKFQQSFGEKQKHIMK